MRGKGRPGRLVLSAIVAAPHQDVVPSSCCISAQLVGEGSNGLSSCTDNVAAIHFVQADLPDDIGKTIVDWMGTLR
jgi:hypothetical protein